MKILSSGSCAILAFLLCGKRIRRAAGHRDVLGGPDSMEMTSEKDASAFYAETKNSRAARNHRLEQKLRPSPIPPSKAGTLPCMQINTLFWTDKKMLAQLNRVAPAGGFLHFLRRACARRTSTENPEYMRFVVSGHPRALREQARHG